MTLKRKKKKRNKSKHFSLFCLHHCSSTSALLGCSKKKNSSKTTILMLFAIKWKGYLKRNEKKKKDGLENLLIFDHWTTHITIYQLTQLYSVILLNCCKQSFSGFFFPLFLLPLNYGHFFFCSNKFISERIRAKKKNRKIKE